MNFCWMCGSGDVLSRQDVLDGHTLLESEFICRKCGYYTEFSYGHSAERIGRYFVVWSYNDQPEAERRRGAATSVARLIRRYELGLMSLDEAGFLSALAANPGDFTPAKVYADWLDEHRPDRGWDAHRLREYDDASGFEAVYTETATGGPRRENPGNLSPREYQVAGRRGWRRDFRPDALSCEFGGAWRGRSPPPRRV